MDVSEDGRAEIIREKGTNRAQFLQGQVDKYTWVDIGSSFLPSDGAMAINRVIHEHPFSRLAA